MIDQTNDVEVVLRIERDEGGKKGMIAVPERPSAKNDLDPDGSNTCTLQENTGAVFDMVITTGKSFDFRGANGIKVTICLERLDLDSDGHMDVQSWFVPKKELAKYSLTITDLHEWKGGNRPLLRLFKYRFPAPLGDVTDGAVGAGKLVLSIARGKFVRSSGKQKALKANPPPSYTDVEDGGTGVICAEDFVALSGDHGKEILFEFVNREHTEARDTVTQPAQGLRRVSRPLTALRSPGLRQQPRLNYELNFPENEFDISDGEQDVNTEPQPQRGKQPVVDPSDISPWNSRDQDDEEVIPAPYRLRVKREPLTTSRSPPSTPTRTTPRRRHQPYPPRDGSHNIQRRGAPPMATTREEHNAGDRSDGEPPATPTKAVRRADGTIVTASGFLYESPEAARERLEMLELREMRRLGLLGDNTPEEE